MCSNEIITIKQPQKYVEKHQKESNNNKNYSKLRRRRKRNQQPERQYSSSRTKFSTEMASAEGTDSIELESVFSSKNRDFHSSTLKSTSGTTDDGKCHFKSE